MEPIKVCELEAGIPKNQVPRFHTMAENSKEKTMINPWVESIPSSRSMGSRWTMA